MGQRSKWFLRTAGLTVVLGVLGALVYLHTSAFREMLERRATSAITRQLGRECRLRLVRVRPFALSAEVENLWIAGAHQGDPAFVELDAISIDARWSLLLQRRLGLSDVVATGLRIDLDQLPSPRSDDAAPRATPTTFEDLTRLLAIDRLTVSDGVVRWGNETVPVSVTAGGVSLSLQRGDGANDHWMRVEIASGTLDLPAVGAALPFSSRGELSMDASGLRLTRLELGAAGIDLRATGELTDLAALSGSAEARLEARPAESAATGTVLDEVRGEATAEASSRFSADDFEVAATLTSARLGWRDWSADDVRLELRGSGDGWKSTLSGSMLGLQVNGEIEGASLHRLTPVSARVKFESTEVERLLTGLGDSRVVPISGPVGGQIAIRAEAPELDSIRGTFFVESRALGYDRQSRARLSSDVSGSIENGRITIDQLRARGSGLSLEGRGFTEFEGQTDLRLDLDVRDASQALVMTRTICRELGVNVPVPETVSVAHGTLRATAAVRGPGIKGMTLDTMMASVDADARGMTLAGTRGLPLDLRAGVTLEAGRFTLRDLSARGHQVAVDGSGWFAPDGTLRAELDIEVSELGETARGILEELRAFGVNPTRVDPATRAVGNLHLEADVTGHWNRLAGRLSLSGDGLGVDGIDERRALRSDAELKDGGLDVRARLEGERSYVAVQADLDSYLRPAAGFVDIELSEASPALWAAVVGMDVPAQGTVEANARYDVSSGAVRGRVDVHDGMVSDVPFELESGVVVLSRERLEIEHAELRVPGGLVTIDGALGSQGGRAELHVRTEAFDLGEALRPLGAAVQVEGLVDLDTLVTGHLNDPTVQGQVSLATLKLSGRRLPPLAGPISYVSAALEIDLSEPGGDSSVSARASFEESTPWHLRARYPLRIDLNALADSPPTRTPLELEAVLFADLAGRALQADEVEGQIELRNARLRVGEDVLVAKDGPRIDMAKGRARIAPFRIEGGGLVLHAEGELPFVPGQPVAARVTGHLPLALLSGRVPGLKLGGDSELNVQLSGTLASPSWKGTVHLERGRLSHPGLPAPLENVEATVVLAADRWTVENLSSRFGGGRLRGSGAYSPTGDQAGYLRLTLTGDAIRVPLIEGLRSEFDTNLVLDGRADDTLDLSGNVRFARAAYIRDIDIGRQLRARARGVTVGTEVGGLLDRIRLDLDAAALGSLWVRNNLASIETTAALKIRGTAAAPSVTGEVELEEGGRVFFRQVTYYVRRGTLRYVSDPPENPLIDIEAQTTVARHDVNLLLSGRLQDPKVDLSSDPPLSQADIVSLLVTGRTRDELAQATGGLAETQAALYLSSGLTRETERILQRSLGLDQVRIDPVLVAGETDPTARLTLGKTLTAKTSMTYSRALGGTQADIYELRHEPITGLSILATRDEDGEHAVDAVQTKRFFWGPSSPTVDSGARRAERPIVRLTIESGGEIKAGRLRRAMDLRKGARYRESVLLAALDAARESYKEAGFPEARVDAEVTDEDGGVAITVVIDAGRRVSLDVEGSKVSDEIRNAVFTVWQQSIFPEDIAGEAAALIRRKLRGRGFVQAEVTCELVEIGSTAAKLHVKVFRGPRIRVDRLVVEGNSHVDDERVRSELLTEESSWLVPKWLSAETIEEDREALRALYTGLGFLDVEVGEVEISYPRSETRGVVKIAIEEGIRYRIGTIDFKDNEAFDDETLRTTSRLASGTPFLDADLRAARERLRSSYDAGGYPDVRIELKTSIRRDDGQVDVLFAVSEGPHKFVESLEIVGARLTREKVVQRALDLAVGDPLSSDSVATTRQKLYRTGLFRSVAVVEESGQSEDGRRLVFTVEERPNAQVDYGLGVTTDDGIRGSTRISHSNLGGRRLYGSLGGRASQNDWRVFALLRQPQLFGSSLQGVSSAFLENEQQESFDVRRIGATLQLDSNAENRRWRWFAGYGLEAVDILREGVVVSDGSGLPPEVGDLIDPRAESTLRLGNLYSGFVAGTVDDFTWPTRGNLLQTKAAVFAPAVLSEAELARGFIQWSFHRPLAKRRVIWNSGLRVGLIDTYGSTTQTPLSERFFTGGDNSIRGFARDSIVAVGFPGAELSALGIVVEESLGGNALLVANQELVVTLRDPVAAVLFYDTGNVYWQMDDFDPTELRHAAGLGLRVRTPAGPLRLEYAWKLDRSRDESRGRVHFSIGFPF